MSEFVPSTAYYSCPLREEKRLLNIALRSVYVWRLEIKRCLATVKRKPLVEFTKSKDWQRLRHEAFALHGRVCLKCGSTKKMSVDHIKPISIYPELMKDIDNLQPLCYDCNTQKGCDVTDYR